MFLSTLFNHTFLSIKMALHLISTANTNAAWSVNLSVLLTQIYTNYRPIKALSKHLKTVHHAPIIIFVSTFVNSKLSGLFLKSWKIVKIITSKVIFV